ncbi:MAG: DUF1998 domain-containing protein [Desulfurococcales archaeon]|nr:DUF1998 domain-containing protein [Desulfurococcales archaeon]
MRLADILQELRSVIEELEAMDIIKLAGNRVYPNWSRARSFLEAHGSLRSAGPQVKIFEGKKEIGRREMPLALYDLYPGAIYYHAGKTYLSLKLDVTALRADVRRVGGDVSFYTKPLYTIDVASIYPLDERVLGPLRLVYGDVKLIVRVEGYVVKEEYTGTTLSEVIYDEPISWDYWTKGVAVRYPNPGITDNVMLLSSYHALEHAIISASKPVVGASDTDLGGVSYPTGHIVIYDSTPGGNGASRLVFERMERIHDIAENILVKCDCEDGCPKCVFSPYCGVNNRFLSRKGAYKVLHYAMTAPERLIIKLETPMGKPLA